MSILIENIGESIEKLDERFDELFSKIKDLKKCKTSNFDFYLERVIETKFRCDQEFGAIKKYYKEFKTILLEREVK